jgi:hypothetical protein
MRGMKVKKQMIWEQERKETVPSCKIYGKTANRNDERGIVMVK